MTLPYVNNFQIFKLPYFQIQKMTTEEIILNIEKALEEIRPFLQSDGGDISFVSIEDDKHVKVRLEGACVACNVNQMTLRAGVETTIKKHVPQIETVVNIA